MLFIIGSGLKRIEQASVAIAAGQSKRIVAVAE